MKDKVIKFVIIVIIIVFDEYFVRLADEEEYHSVELVKFDLETDIAVLRISGFKC